MAHTTSCGNARGDKCRCSGCGGNRHGRPGSPALVDASPTDRGQRWESARQDWFGEVGLGEERSQKRLIAPATEMSGHATEAAGINRADRGLFDDGAGARVAAQLRAEQQQEREAEYWQPSWRPQELTDWEYHQQFVAPYERGEDRGTTRATASIVSEPQKKGGGCAGAALLFMATGAATTVAVSGMWPF